MKRSTTILLALLAMLSCTRESLPLTTNSIEVGLSQAGTKTSLEGSKIYWSNGDRISANGVESEALSDVPAQCASAKFALGQDVSYPISILYPSAFYKDAQTITLPSLQSRAENSFATGTFPCAGILSSEGENVTLKNLCALVKVQVTSSHNHPIKGVIFKGGAGEQVCGDFTVDYSACTLTPEGGSSQLKLSTGLLSPGDTPADLYFVVPAGSYSGLSFRIIDTQNHYMDVSKKSGITLSAGTMYSFSSPVDFVPTKTLVDIGQGDFGSNGAVVRKISSAAEWNTFATSYNAGEFSNIDPAFFTVQIAADLDFKGTELVTINNFSGAVEGRGHLIKNLSAYGPLFSSLTNACATDIHFDSSCTFVSDNSDESFGPIAGSISGKDCIIENCASDAHVTSNAIFTGGLVGTLESGTLMRYCTNNGIISADGTVGGIVGRLLDCDMDDCSNYGSVTCTSGEGTLGGMIGLAASDKCIITGGGNYGKLTGNCTRRGLLVGEFKNISSMSGCFVGGSIEGAVITADNWKTDFVGYGYSGVASRITGLTSLYSSSSPLSLKDAPLRILFIGNSFTDDAVKHLPGLICAAGLSDKITMAHMYYGGRIMEEYNDWSKADYTLNKFEAGDTGWTAHSSTVSISDVAMCGRWDIITMQEHTGNWHGWVWNADEKACFDGMFDKLGKTQLTKPKYWYIFSQAYYMMNKIGAGSRSYMTWPLENTKPAQLTMYGVIAQFARTVMEKCPFDGILATGTMLQNLRTSEVSNVMDLTRDGYHMDYGITRYGAACLLFESLITPKFGVKLDDNTYRYSSSSTEDGKYSTPVTNENAPIALAAARYAIAKPYEITDMAPQTEPANLKGEGTSASPYLIGTADDMKEISKALKKNTTVYFKMAADINMSSVTDWTPCSTSDAGYIIDYDGDGYTVSNFKCTGKASCSLFGVLCGSVRNLNFSSCNVSAEGECGILAAKAGTSSPVALHNVHASGCTVASTLVGTVNTGGLVATIGNATVTNCSFGGTVSTKSKSGYSGFIGGLVGQVTSESTFKRCCADVEVKGTSNNYCGGGLVGGSTQNVAVTVRDCYTTGSMTAVSYFGGVIGELSTGATVTNCYSTMTLFGTYALGGVVGRACNYCNPNSSKTFDTDVNITVRGCIAWNPSITSGNKTTPANGYSSGAVVAFNVNKNVLASCVRRPDMVFDMFPQADYNILVDQPDFGPSYPYSKLGSETYYMPYHGRAAASGATVSSVARSLGWNADVWDFSGDCPVLKLLPADFNDRVVSSTKKKVSIIGDSISTFKGWISSENVGGKVCTTHYPNTSNTNCDVLKVEDTWWYKLIYNKMGNAQFEANISSGNTTVVANTTATSYSSQYWYNWDFCTRLTGLGVGSPDVVFIHGGTNDLGHINSYGASECLIGTQTMNSTAAPDPGLLAGLFATADAATTRAAAEGLDATTFCSAYIKLMQMLKVRYPSAKVVCLVGDCLSAGMQSAVKSISAHYGAKYVDFLAINGFKGNTIIGKYDGGTHPNAAGMEYMASEIYRELGPWLEE
ncbi:MAG: DUF4886 domain-containing protein [Bacteroidales bacterium]|nr:DUF4886 domain-containing protein [Bacteroidales bacterium]